MSTANSKPCKRCGFPISSISYLLNGDGPFCKGCIRSVQLESLRERPSLLDAVTELYDTGHWTCEAISHEEQVRLWTQVRDAAGLKNPEPIPNVVQPHVHTPDCEWTVLNPPIGSNKDIYRTGCDKTKVTYGLEILRPFFCPNCGGRIVEVL